MRLRSLRAAAALGMVLALPMLAAPAAAVPGDPGSDPVAAPVLTPGSGPVSVALVVPLTMPADESGMLDAATLETSTSPAGALSRQLDEILQAPAVVIALDPMIPASIRALGSAAPESALDWLARLEAAPHEVFLLAYADADLGELAAAAALGAAAPLGFAFALNPGDFGPAQTAAPTPTEGTDEPSEEPSLDPDGEDDGGPVEAPPLPTTEDLLAWPAALTGIAWPAEGTLTAGTLPAFAAAGYGHLIVGSANLSETRTALADLGGIGAVVADSGISELVREASVAVGEDERLDALTRLGAALDGMAARDPGRTVVATLDRHWPVGVFRLSSVAAAIDANAASQLVPLSAVLTGPSATASVVDAVPDPDRAGRIGALVAADAAENAFATILTDPLLLTAPRRLELLNLLAISRPAPGQWADDSAAYLDRSREILESVQVVEGSTLQVISSATNLRIAVSNRLEFPVTVRVEARPLRPLIKVDAPVEITIEPDSSRTATLPAQAITRGQVSVEVTLSHPVTHVQVGSSRLLRVDLQPEWETVGIVVGAVVVVVFALGIVRNIVIRSRAAKKRTEDGDEDGTGDRDA